MANFLDSWRAGGTGHGGYTLASRSTSEVPLILQLITSQVANGFEIKNALGTTIFSVSPTGDVTYTGSETVTDALTVTGATHLLSTLEVDGTSTFDGAMILNGEITMGASGRFVNGINVTGNSTIEGATTIHSLTVEGDLTLQSGYLRSKYSANIYIYPSPSTITVVGGTNSTSHSLSTNSDMFINGVLEIDGITYPDGGIVASGSDIHVNDDVSVSFGNTLAAPNAKILWETADANANELIFVGPTGDGTDVPVFVFGDTTLLNKDLGLFNGVTAPTIAVVSDDATKATYFQNNGTDGLIRTTSNGKINISQSNATDADTYTTYISATTTGATGNDNYLVPLQLDGTYNLEGGTLGNYIALWIKNPTKTAGTITTATGLYVEAITVGATNYNIYASPGNTLFIQGATHRFWIDSDTTDRTSTQALYIDLGVNSASVQAQKIDVDVGTALSSAEQVDGLYIDFDGIAGDAADSLMNAIYLTSTNATGGVNTAVNVAGVWDVGVKIGRTGTAAGAGEEYNSNILILESSAWETATSTEDRWQFRIYNDPTAGVNSSALLKFTTSVDGAAEVLRMSITSGGNVISGAGFSANNGNFFNSASVTSTLRGNDADDATGIGVVLDNSVTLTNAASKLVSIQNNTVEKAYFDYLGGLTVSQGIATAGAAVAGLTITGGAHTGLTAATEAYGVNFNLSATKTWATGAGPLAAQREVVFQAPTYAGGVAALTMTKAATVAITNAPQVGANMAITNAYALWVQAGTAQFDGGIGVATSFFLADDVYLKMGNTSDAPDVGIAWNTTQTVDALYVGLSAAQNTMIIGEYADIAYDFAHGAQTNPTIFIQSATQSATQWGSLAHDQTDFVLASGAGMIHAKPIANSSFKVTATDTNTTGATSYGIYATETSTAVVTGTNQNLYGGYFATSKTGADTNANTTNIYGVYGSGVRTGQTDVGSSNTYGGYFTAQGATGGAANVFGVYATATGGDSNYAGYFAGDVTITGALTVDSATLDDNGTIFSIVPTTGHYARIGDLGVTDHALATNDDLLISGNGEVNGTFYMDGAATIYGLFTFAGSNYGGIKQSVDDGLMIAPAITDGYSNHNVIISGYANKDKDHDHDTPSTNPTLIIHSALDPDTSNNQWGSASHNQENFVISTGANVGTGTGATTDNNGVLIAPSDLTSSGTANFALSVTRTLNDATAAGGSDLFNGILLDVIPTNVTGWNTVNLMDLQYNTLSVWKLSSLGLITHTPTTTGTLYDMVLETEWTTGTLINADFGGATTQSGDMYGVVMDFNANLAGVTDLDVTGMVLKTPALTQSAANTTTYIGWNLSTAGALVQDTLAGTINWSGINIQMPNTTAGGGGTVTSRGISIAGGTITSGTEAGIYVNMANGADTALQINTGATVLNGSVGIIQTPTPSVALTCGWSGAMIAATTAARHGYFTGNITELANAVITDIVGVYVNNFTVTDAAGTETVGILAGLYIPNAPTAGTAPTNGPYALFIDDGNSRIDGTLHLGKDDVIGAMDIHDAGTIIFRDDSDDTSVTLGPVANGTTSLGITGGINATATVQGATVTDGTFSVTAGAVTGVTTLAMGGALSGVTTLGMAGDLTDYEAVNDGSPQFILGSSAAEQLSIQTVYNAGAQTLDYVQFQTATAGAAGKGVYKFGVDGTDVMTIVNGGITVTNALTGAGIDLNITSVAYTTLVGGLDIIRSGAITGVDTETMVDLNIKPLFTLTEPGAGTFVYYGAAIDMSTVSVTAGAGTSTIAALYLKSNSDADAGEKYALYAEGSCRVLGRILETQGADVASANDTSLGFDGNYFDITGAVQMNGIAAAGWTAGSIVTLQFDGAPTVKHNTAASAGFASFQLAGAGDFVASAGDTLTLRYDGTYWRECARTVI